MLSQEQQIAEMNNPKYQTVDFSKIKDFLNWGMNRALSDLRMRRMVDVKTREKLGKKKAERDWVKLMIAVVVIVIIAGIAFMMINTFFNYQDVIQSLSQCIIDKATVQGDLAQCHQKAGIVAGKIVG